MFKKTIDNLNLEGKKVLLRVDFNVPMLNGEIQSDKRILAALPTIQKIIDKKGKIIIFSHLGRVKNEEDKTNNDLAPVALYLAQKLGKKVEFVNQTRGKDLEAKINSLKNGELLMLQNTRFEDVNGKLESKNDYSLGKYWASLGDVFINDAFGTAHRAHASNVGIASFVKESAIGYLVQKELKMLGNVVKNPTPPFVAIIGGAKVSDKIGIIENLLKKADKILVGGGMSYTFLKALNYKIGDSLVEPQFFDMAKKFIDEGKNKLILPLDFAISNEYKNNHRQTTSDVNIPDGFMGLDIGPKTIELYSNLLKGAKTIIWNGPMGVAEFSNFKKGTESIAQAIAEETTAFSIIGGGDSAAAAIKLGFEDKFTHISTGGGASLTYLEGKKLPGIEIVQDSF